jgi:hypothetical protein
MPRHAMPGQMISSCLSTNYVCIALGPPHSNVLHTSLQQAAHRPDLTHYLLPLLYCLPVQNLCEGLLLAAEKGKAGATYHVTDGDPIDFRVGLEYRVGLGLGCWVGQGAWAISSAHM